MPSAGSCGGRKRHMMSRPASASPSPSEPPAIASTMASVSNCVITRLRDAPMATRIDISRFLPAARASSRLAMLKHAITSTIPTTAINMTPARLNCARWFGLMLDFQQRLQRERAALVGQRKSCFQVRGNRLQLSLGLLRTRAIFQPGHSVVSQKAPFIEKLLGESGKNLVMH